MPVLVAPALATTTQGSRSAVRERATAQAQSSGRQLKIAIDGHRLNLFRQHSHNLGRAVDRPVPLFGDIKHGTGAAPPGSAIRGQ